MEIKLETRKTRFVSVLKLENQKSFLFLKPFLTQISDILKTWMNEKQKQKIINENQMNASNTQKMKLNNNNNKKEGKNGN